MKARVLLYILFLLLALDIVLGYSISSYNTNFEVVDNSVITTTYIEFEGLVSDVLILRLPRDSSNLEVYLDEELVEPSLDGNTLSLNLTSVRSVKLEYETSDLLDKSSFLLDLVLPYNASNVEIILTLPEGFVLREPLEESDPLAGSIYPKPDKALTDGRRLIFVWERENMGKGDEIPIYVKYKESVSYWNYVLPIIAAIVIVALVFDQIRRPKAQTKGVNIRKHLKEDEEVIVNILKQREGHMCEQGTLRVITGMPKASLSRLLKELEDRKVIYKEKRGKKNLVFLKD